MGGPGLAVGEWERVCVDRGSTCARNGSQRQGTSLKPATISRKGSTSRGLVRLYSTHSADRRKYCTLCWIFLLCTSAREMVCHWARATDTKAHKSVSVKRRLARISNGEFARRGGRTEGFLHFSALLGTRHMAAFVREPLSLWALDVFFFLFFPGKGFLFCMAVNRSKGARGIRRLFVDYIVWQAECESAYLLNLLKVISWLILFVRANLATSKGTPHLHIPQKWIFF